MIVQPMINPIILTLIAAGFVFIVWKLIRQYRDHLRTSFLHMAALTLICVMLGVIGLRPMIYDNDRKAIAKNIDVLFVVDTTLSMWANDSKDGTQRMDAVQEDINHIMEEMAGASFGLIRFDNQSQILSPFTTDTRNVRDALKIMLRPASGYAKGSTMGLPLEDMKLLLESSYNKKNRLTVVFFISDGEETADKEPASFASLHTYIDSGAVMGYGTAGGGTMSYRGGSSVYDPDTGEAAVSHIDESNLQQIASDLGVDYIHMGEKVGPDHIVKSVMRSCSRSEDAKSYDIYQDIYYIFAGIILACVALEVLDQRRRGSL
ncbi:MAG: VWA domain-containing protein [Solobacterium sp.]|nr:VWA domain-containing protein [Solobacterium sp.]